MMWGRHPAWANRRPPLRRASLDTSPPIDGGEEGRELASLGSLPLPPEGGEEGSEFVDQSPYLPANLAQPSL
ncbi:hypothetical protein EN974_11045 [Mesorhizobium sp. M7A.F.Ca.CA.001.12.2.1]|nr:hypothetical protein EN974_11045 [Mesorhizobium sp. M7A.F.Ca.CA.001.12.2.1]RUZ30667.1 hypothetical protein EN949_00115 [Mesorhizobium sp. M7A.F.Ca.US.007.01.2.1]RUZ44768.1 hypothetical protein EN948_21790 [Mesorhizobium sp. M7A.F.Ca.US.003.02.1.1]RUZ64452.1 hypothetical protein EN950_14135 [Mesorhizobium sp. M7A.F.Ca.US.007.01.1.1]RUZ84616.1 hypothetical protein EN947_14035 [Mesorhizobium sp. M7A.F.Ca.US.003.02.2.1]